MVPKWTRYYLRFGFHTRMSLAISVAAATSENTRVEMGDCGGELHEGRELRLQKEP